MSAHKSYFFCGIGGSGMLPLALILKAAGHRVCGSDRALDQGRTAPKFDFLRAQGIGLFPQDGSGVTDAGQIVVASAAVEDTVPDIARAVALGCPRLSRAALLSELFNASPQGIAVGGTSGKSTTTGMIGWIFHALGRRPTVMNGAVMKNFVTADAPFASALVGDGDAFISEVDESDGSIALYNPAIAVLNNISLDHKSLDELHVLFGNFTRRAGRAVVNLDDAEASVVAAEIHADALIGVGFNAPAARLAGSALVEEPTAVSFTVTDRETGASAAVRLAVPGRHNAQNGLSALGAAVAAGIPLADAAGAIAGFTGLSRRMDIVGTMGGVTVIDDFGHNPDKIAATLSALHAFPGRLLLFFQPHGYGPLRLMGDALVDTFVGHMGGDDVLLLCDPVYFGGTVSRDVGSGAIVAAVAAGGRAAEYHPSRAACGDRLVARARPGDRIVVMGARDDTLSAFAADLLRRVGGDG
ncbi:glutamate ligase domain-containing protein [Sphingomonas flavalba]|uniref:glutamate ligase domain-containing protein n=1 Tax=Sphingomonas flavalba TaxID=2559804 RepID=UPI00109E06E1|nr:Mur ligase family protein [Sphingomonas flavalba]